MTGTNGEEKNTTYVAEFKQKIEVGKEVVIPISAENVFTESALTKFKTRAPEAKEAILIERRENFGSQTGDKLEAQIAAFKLAGCTVTVMPAFPLQIFNGFTTAQIALMIEKFFAFNDEMFAKHKVKLLCWDKRVTEKNEQVTRMEKILEENALRTDDMHHKLMKETYEDYRKTKKLPFNADDLNASLQLLRRECAVILGALSDFKYIAYVNFNPCVRHVFSSTYNRIAKPSFIEVNIRGRGKKSKEKNRNLPSQQIAPAMRASAPAPTTPSFFKASTETKEAPLPDHLIYHVEYTERLAMFDKSTSDDVKVEFCRRLEAIAAKFFAKPRASVPGRTCRGEALSNEKILSPTLRVS